MPCSCAMRRIQRSDITGIGGDFEKDRVHWRLAQTCGRGQTDLRAGASATGAERSLLLGLFPCPCLVLSLAQVCAQSIGLAFLACDQFGAGSCRSGTRRRVLVHAADDGGWRAESIGQRPSVLARIGGVCEARQKAPQGGEFRTRAIDAQKVVHIGIGGTPPDEALGSCRTKVRPESESRTNDQRSPLELR